MHCVKEEKFENIFLLQSQMEIWSFLWTEGGSEVLMTNFICSKASLKLA